MLALSNDPVWFCLRAEPKREHLAATALRRRFGIECLSPRLRFRKLTQRGPVWFVEAMFPGYLFAKFVYSTQYRAVESSHGVRGILRFGERLATLPEDTVIALQSKAGAEEVVTVDSSPKIGQPVQLIEGPFQGLEVVVTQLLPARERIRVLLEFFARTGTLLLEIRLVNCSDTAVPYQVHRGLRRATLPSCRHPEPDRPGQRASNGRGHNPRDAV